MHIALASLEKGPLYSSSFTGGDGAVCSLIVKPTLDQLTAMNTCAHTHKAVSGQWIFWDFHHKFAHLVGSINLVCP